MYLRDKVSQKHSKEQFEGAQKIEQEYSKFFTGVCATETFNTAECPVQTRSILEDQTAGGQQH